jgi:hypothetical protein
MQNENEIEDNNNQNDSFLSANSMNDNSEIYSDNSSQIEIKKEHHLQNLMISQDNNIKRFSSISVILCFLMIFISILISFKKKIILTFNFENKKDEEEIEMNMNYFMFLFYLFLLDIFNAGLIFLIYKTDSNNILSRIIFKHLRWYFVLTEIIFGISFCIFFLLKPQIWTYILNVSIYLGLILILSFYFQDIKLRKNLDFKTFIFLSVYISILFSFIIYSILYNLCNILFSSYKNYIINLEKEEKEKDKFLDNINFYLQIINYMIQTIISVILLAYVKDIFFNLSTIYIFFALILNNNLNGRNIYWIISLISILIIGTISTIIKYKWEVLGIEKNYLNIKKISL